MPLQSLVPLIVVTRQITATQQILYLQEMLTEIILHLKAHTFIKQVKKM
jgi:hypothetical protein